MIRFEPLHLLTAFRKSEEACPERCRRAVYSIMGTIEPARRDDDGESTRQLEAAAQGDGAAWGAVLAQHRERACGGWSRCAWTAGSRGGSTPPT